MSGIILKNISVNFDGKQLYDNFDAQFGQNKVHVILGKSGSGKSTLLNVVANLVKYQGSCQCGKISYVFQQSRLAPIDVESNVKLVLDSSLDKNECKQIVQKYIAIAELVGKEKQNVETLSGGERQRVALARAFAYQSEVLLMDEPFKSLDLGIKRRLLATLNALLVHNPKTVLFVTHDVEEAIMLADSVYLLENAPCQLTKLADIDVPFENRDLYSQQFVQLRKQLESKM